MSEVGIKSVSQVSAVVMLSGELNTTARGSALSPLLSQLLRRPSPLGCSRKEPGRGCVRMSPMIGGRQSSARFVLSHQYRCLNESLEQ